MHSFVYQICKSLGKYFLYLNSGCMNLYLYLFFRENEVWISCESSARQMIHMKCEVLFSLRNN